MSASQYIPQPKIPDWLLRIVSKPPKQRQELLAPLYQTLLQQEEQRIDKGFSSCLLPSSSPFDPTPFSISSAPHNLHRNRYSDVLPFNYNRVKLNQPSPLSLKYRMGADGGSDYINASYVGGFGYCDSYIAAQGPLDVTIPDFYNMVVDRNSRVILMLTPLVENRKTKCAKYWPDLGFEIECRNVVVKNIREESEANEDITIRYLEVNGKQVAQIHFDGWADHRASGIDSVLKIIEIANRVQKEFAQKDEKVGPMVVHCSAGCGRTGTFIAINTAIKAVEGSEQDVIYATVASLREQRLYMVQTYEQFAFCYEALYRWCSKWQAVQSNG